MKKIVEHKVYDTDTAQEIHLSSCGECGSYGHSETSIFKTEKGAYFFYTYKIPFSGNHQMDILPCTKNEVIDHLIELNAVEEIIEEFPEYYNSLEQA